MGPQLVSLRFAPGAPRIALRELTGRDERLVRDTSTATAITLIDRLVQAPADVTWRSASALAPTDRDRLLGAIYRLAFGSRVESTSRCTSCDSLFDLSFELDDLMGAVEQARTSSDVEALDDGIFRTGGIRFRLPTGDDELAIAALPDGTAPQALIDRCLFGQPATADVRALVEKTIEDVAPIIDLDIDTRCPECGVSQAVHFDLQYFLLQALQRDRKQIAKEIHRIASAYGWSLDETLSLSRSERRLFVDLIEAEQPVRRRTR